MKKYIPKIIILVLIDQLIKLIAFYTLGKSGKSIVLIPKVLSLFYYENASSSFGIFSGRILLIALDLMIIVFIVKLFYDKKYDFVSGVKLGLSLVLAGGIGNLIDRVFRGYVIDYIDISKIVDWPIFNFADSCIVVGVILIMIVVIISTIQKQERT